MDRSVGHADRTHQSELGLHEQILQRVFGDSGQRAIHIQRAGAVAHGVKLEIAERDCFHFAVGRMVVDPVLIAAKTVAGIQDRRVLVGGPRQLIQPAPRQRAQAVEMRLEPPKIIRLQIYPEKIAQAAIDRVEILPGTIRCDVIGAAIGTLRFSGGAYMSDLVPPADWLARRRTGRSISPFGDLFQLYRSVRSLCFERHRAIHNYFA